MDSVYGTKKYFQSLAGVDPYRGSTCRALANDYPSYQNSFGRQSPIGPYMHMSKHASYSTDMSLTSQCGYNTWGTWNDVRNTSPTIYSTKSRQHRVRSCSIILITAAFIVLLAVLSIAGLAFYFSSFKTNLDESLMMFEGSFRIQKGDLYSSGLRYNNSAVFRQKADFYRRFIERSLSDNDLQLSKLDVRGFGDGPLINVHFIAVLDMRKIPQNIHSVEEHIRNSLFLETNSVRSLYKFIKIEPDSVEIKRITGDDVNRVMPTLNHQDQTINQAHFEKKLSKTQNKASEKPNVRHPPTQRSKTQNGDEPEVDVENAPVIQGSFEGSFEITKTDADITAKKTSPTKSFSPYTKYLTTTIASRSKTKKAKPEKTTTTTVIPTTPTAETTTTIETTEAQTTTTTTTSTTTPITTTTTTTTSTTSEMLPTTPTAGDSDTLRPSESDDTKQESTMISNFDDTMARVKNPPKFDLSLFTSAPVLDTKPWHPIYPNNPSSSQYNPANYASQSKVAFTLGNPTSLEALEIGMIPKNNVQLSEHVTEAPNKMLFYQSFTNPVFMPGNTGIERLGNSDVKPYPIPVPLIDEVVAPDTKSVLPMQVPSDTSMVPEVVRTEAEIDSAVSAPIEVVSELPEDPILMDSSSSAIETSSNLIQDEITLKTDTIGELLLDLLELPSNATTKFETTKIEETQIAENETEKPLSFLNIKDIVLNQTKIESSSPASELTTTEPIPGTLDQSLLFPTNTKWELFNETDGFESKKPPVKKVFNQTLQAWIVENQDDSDIETRGEEVKRNSSEDIQNITLIFDNLASKLGITQNFPTKFPPFSTSSQQKYKQGGNRPIRPQPESTTTTTTTMAASTPSPSSSTSTSTSTTTSTTTTSELPILITSSEFPSLVSLSSEREPILGEAEVEVVDPKQYEEMLSSQFASSSTTQAPTLVTLLPVKSNSGIRIFKPTVSESISQSRKFSNFSPIRYREAIVKSGIQVTA